ncbi:ferric reductase-like transmembrane domain-containing protein [Microaerobacter geothermalis]|uniref:ferric reductase-like transmembrane domain-containing protein n=1 Tax=Microaerobacter geothermalis TaxID=674972 RepID=UPI001F20A3B0|nr:ferric reductase-like transmembrane domain-containing protein [Microaerobacter geothermalis]MCF6092495.1 ferric reductase-like transmembrane domain-containing protein [Microaerobacter geothermalis]
MGILSNVNIEEWFPIWETSRAAAVTSYFLLFVSISTGLVLSLKILNGKLYVMFTLIHQWSAWFGFLFALFHGMVLYFDSYSPFTWREIFIPFYRKQTLLWTTLGILSLYGMAILLISSDIFKYLGKKIWRIIHIFSFPTYLFALFHSLFIGTDARTFFFIFFYGATGGIVLFLLTLRFFTIFYQRGVNDAHSVGRR